MHPVKAENPMQPESVSVIIPAYNRAATVQRAIHSVLAQQHENLEVLVVDDGSSDETVAVVEACCRADSRVRLLRHPHSRGAQAARNTGMAAARGSTLAWLDSDDYWLPESLALRLACAQQQGVQVVHSECLVLQPGETTPRLFGVPPMQGSIYREVLRRPGPMFQGLLVSRAALERIGQLDALIASHQEWDTAIRLARHHHFGFVAAPTFVYDCSTAHTISKDARRTARGYAQVVARHQHAMVRHLGPAPLARHYQIIGGLYHQAGENRAAWGFWLLALLLWPFRPVAVLRRLQRLSSAGQHPRHRTTG
jgi:glycosyltransferase involved in cell wall biosynthesis